MVSKISLCVVSGLMCSQPTPMSEDIDTQQKHYSEVSEAEVQQLINDVTIPTFVRDFGTLEKIDYLIGYNEYLEEQERLEQERLEEEQRRLEQERILEEQRRHQEWLDSFNRKGYRQTVFSISEGETLLGSGVKYGDSNVQNFNNVMHYYDNYYGWLPIVAIDMNEVIASGRKGNGTYNAYGSVIEMKQGDRTWKAVVLDSCGACRNGSNKIDLWVYNVDLSLDITNIDWKYIRKGWNDYIG